MKNKLFLFCFLAAAQLFSQNEKPSNPADKGASPLQTQNPPETRNSTRAVVIGISDYQEKDIPDLRFADRDAEAFANFLRSPAGGRLDNDHLQVLTNQNATAGQVAAALDWLLEQSKEGDEAIIYFSGHGDVERKTISQPGFLLCWDSPARVYMGGGTFGLAYFQEIVSTLSIQNKAKVLVITDACHAGKLAGSQIGGAQLTSSNLARQYANEVKILSCQPNEFSLEGEQWGGGRGIFSYHLVDGLFGLADRSGDGTVSVGEIDRYLEDKVTAEAAPQSQVPMLLGNKTERLATVSAAILADLKKSKAGGMPVFAATEGRGFEDDVLAKLDSGIVKRYFSFKKAVAEKRFFQPENDCAETFYASLSTEPGLAPLHGFLKRNYAAALQDGAQQVLNTMLKSGLTLDVLSGKHASDIYKDYPAWLGRAAGLLGSGHYMYATLQARKSFFEGKIQPARSEARKHYHNALGWQPDLPHAYVELVSTCSKQEADSAEIFAQKAMEIAPEWVVPYIRLSVFYGGRMRNTEKAEALLLDAHKLDTSSVLVWYSLGKFYRQRGESQKAEFWMKKSVSGTGEGICFPCAHMDMGYQFMHTNRLPEAEHHFNMALQLDSTFYGAYNGLGSVYRLNKRFEEAEKAYQKHIDAAKSGRDKAPSMNEMGNLFGQLGQLDKAETYYRMAVINDSTHYNATSNLVNLLIVAKRFDDAKPHLESLSRLQPENAEVPLTLAAIAYCQNRRIDAEVLHRKGIELNPSGDVYYYFACYLSSCGLPEMAFDNLDNAFMKGFSAGYDWVQKDKDLAPLRALPEWKAMMKKHFPDKAKD